MSRSRATAFEEKLRDGTVIDHIHKIAVQAGDAIFLPAGRVHAIGAGNLLIEIQQNSDTTYRVFDWNRTDPATGTKRDLHVEQAIQCIDFEDVQPKLIQSEGELLISDSLFEIRKWNLDEAREAAPLGQFAIVCCLTGNLSCAKAEACARRIFSYPSPFRGPATETTRARHKSVASDDPETVALDLNPVPLDGLPIFNRHHVCFLLQLFVSRRRHDERSRST